MANDKPNAPNDQLYFVEVIVNWGKQNGDEQVTESTGGQNWGYLTYDQAVALENVAVIPNVNQMNTDAGEMGLEVIDQGDVVKSALAARAKDKVK